MLPGAKGYQGNRLESSSSPNDSTFRSRNDDGHAVGLDLDDVIGPRPAHLDLELEAPAAAMAGVHDRHQVTARIGRRLPRGAPADVHRGRVRAAGLEAGTQAVDVHVEVGGAAGL